MTVPKITRYKQNNTTQLGCNANQNCYIVPIELNK